MFSFGVFGLAGAVLLHRYIPVFVQHQKR
jgi:hypothetical protein